jgi:hypothetical protein
LVVVITTKPRTGHRASLARLFDLPVSIWQFGGSAAALRPVIQIARG